MSKAKRGVKSQQGRLADMSLPAQLGHATGAKARRKAREGERKMERERGERE